MTVWQVVQFAALVLVVDYLMIKALAISLEAGVLTAGLILLTLLVWVAADTIDDST